MDLPSPQGNDMKTRQERIGPTGPQVEGQILRVAAEHGVLRPRIFGSRARGQASPTSDLDLLVEMAANRDLLDLIAFKQDLEDLLGYSVDIVTEQSLSPHLRERVLREAREL